MNRNSELIGVVETMKNTCIQMSTGGEFSYEKYEEERLKVTSYPELKYILPDWLIEHRYGHSFWGFISCKFRTYQERRVFLRTDFDEILDHLKMGSSRPISISIEKSLKYVSSDRLNNYWKKIIERSEHDPEGAITASKTLFEAVMKYVLDTEKVSYSNKDDYSTLYIKLKKTINLDPTKHNVQNFKQILKGISSVIQGFSALRNDYGDAHGTGEKSYIPESRHAELVINLAGSLSAFVIDTYKTKIPEEK